MGSTCWSSGARHKQWWLSVRHRQNWCRSGGEWRSSRDDVVVEGRRWDFQWICDERRKRSNWDHPRHAVEKRWDTWTQVGWWVQEKEASRELQHHNIKGSDNSADLFTKVLDHDSIKPHTENMGCEFIFERDPFAFTVDNLGATLTEMERRLRTKGRMDAWTRMDMHSKTYKTTNKKGLAWRDVAYRATADARSGDIINIEDATDINRDEENRLVEGVRAICSLCCCSRVSVAKMTTSARTMRKKTEGEPRCNAAAAASLERDISAGHMKFKYCMAEIRSTNSRVTWRRSVEKVRLCHGAEGKDEWQGAAARLREEHIVRSVKASSRSWTRTPFLPPARESPRCLAARWGATGTDTMQNFYTGDDKNKAAEDAHVEHAEATKVTKSIGRHPSHADGTASVSTAAEHSAVELHLTVTGSKLRWDLC